MLTFTCPVCATMQQADDLSDMRKHVRMCKAGKTALEPTYVVDTTPLQLPVELVFDRRVASQNKTTYAHWNVHHADKSAWKKLFPAEHTLYGRKLKWSSWVLEDLRGRRAREYDFANLVGGAKPLIDLLTRFGIIVDDKPSCFECSYMSRKAETSGTILRLTDAK